MYKTAKFEFYLMQGLKTYGFHRLKALLVWNDMAWTRLVGEAPILNEQGKVIVTNKCLARVNWQNSLTQTVKLTCRN